MTNHVIVVGYGTKGRGAIQSLLGDGSVRPGELIIIDSNDAALSEARQSGFVAVSGDATRTYVLRQAQVEEARAVIVTCNRDDTATLVTLTAREMNPNAIIVAAVRESENAHLLSQSGASTVIVSAEATGRMLGLAIHQPSAVTVLEDLLVSGRGLQLSQRTVDQREVGGPPTKRDGCLPVAVVRGNSRFAFDDPRFLTTEQGDVVVSINSESGQ